MTRDEFLEVVKFLEAGCSEVLSAESRQVYFKLLGAHEKQHLQEAAQKALRNPNRGGGFPSVALLHELAKSLRGRMYVNPANLAEERARHAREAEEAATFRKSPQFATVQQQLREAFKGVGR